MQEGGTVIKFCTISEIRFHAAKAELPATSIVKVLNLEYSAVFRCDDVMLFRSTGQAVGDKYPEGILEEFTPGMVSGSPVVAVLDGYPFLRHALLENRLLLDDSDEFGSSYQVNEAKH